MINEIVTLITTVGEIVGRVKDIDDSVVTLESPRLFVHNGDSAGFAPGISMTGESNPKLVSFSRGSVLAILKSDEQAANAWIQATSGIVLSR